MSDAVAPIAQQTRTVETTVSQGTEGVSLWKLMLMVGWNSIPCITSIFCPK